MGPNESHFMTVLFAIFILCVFNSWVRLSDIDFGLFLSKFGIPFFS